MEEGECVGGGGKGWRKERKESVKMEDGEGEGGKELRKGGGEVGGGEKVVKL